MFSLLNFILLGILCAQSSCKLQDETDTTVPATNPTETSDTAPTTKQSDEAGTKSSTVAPATKPTETTATAQRTRQSDPFDIDQMLKDIIRTYEPDCQGNAELTSNLDQIRFALKLGNNYTQIKYEALTNFKVYNAVRLLLEKRIKERIDTLNDLLPTLTPNGRCSQFYLKQRQDLKEIEKLSNAEKQARLTQNSTVCPNSEDDNNDDDYVYIDDLFENK